MLLPQLLCSSASHTGAQPLHPPGGDDDGDDDDDGDVHWTHQPGGGGSRVVDVVLSPVLFVDRPLIVTVHHSVNPQNVSLILLDAALRLEYNSVPSCYEEGISFYSGKQDIKEKKKSVKIEES